MAEEKKDKIEVSLPPGMSREAFEKALLTMSKKAPVSNPEDFVLFREWDSGADKIRIYRDVYKGHETNAIRRWYTDKDDGQLKPGRGVSFSFEDIEEIIQGLEDMKTWHAERYAQTSEAGSKTKGGKGRKSEAVGEDPDMPPEASE